MSVRSTLAISVLALAACSDGGGGDVTPDAATSDAQTAWAVEVTCPATPAASFVTSDLSFSPTSATISVGQIVKFESKIEHPIGPFNGDPAETDPALVVPEGRTKCFRFTRAGTFKFICKQHSYLGTLIIN